MTVNGYFENRRDFHRMSMDCELRYAPAGEPPQRIGKLRNLSANGVQFIASETFAEGTQVEVLIEPPGNMTPPLSGIATVVRSDALNGEQQHVIACTLQIKT